MEVYYMKSMKKNIFTLFLAVVTLCFIFPASATMDTLDSSRFRYYTETDPNWTYRNTMTISAEEHEKYKNMEDNIWGFIGGFGNFVPGASEAADVISKFIRQNNADMIDEGTYKFYTKNQTGYKEHLGTGQVYVEWRKMIIRIDFESGDYSDSREITLTLR